jgi:hypothetical protein
VSVLSECPDGQTEIHTVSAPHGASLLQLVATLATLPRNSTILGVTADQIVFVCPLNWDRS